VGYSIAPEGPLPGNPACMLDNPVVRL